jgi:hypothetical protein
MGINLNRLDMIIKNHRDAAIKLGILKEEDAKNYNNVAKAALDISIWETIASLNLCESSDERNKLRLALINLFKIREIRDSKVANKGKEPEKTQGLAELFKDEKETIENIRTKLKIKKKNGEKLTVEQEEFLAAMDEVTA